MSKVHCTVIYVLRELSLYDLYKWYKFVVDVLNLTFQGSIDDTPFEKKKKLV